MDRILGFFQQYLPGVRLYYSVKANNDATILNHLHARGVGFDVASVIELASVLAAGVPVTDVILSNTVKTGKCVRELFGKRVPSTTIDSEHGLRAIANESTFHSFRPRVLARIKLQPSDVQIDLNEKFGCTHTEAVRLLLTAQDLGIPPAGVHFHVGTQCWNVVTYRNGLNAAIAILSELRERHGVDLRTINIGGGYPDELVSQQAGGLQEFFKALGKEVRAVQELGYEVIAEPGRVLSSGACSAVTQVIGRNSHDGREWLYLDDGIYGLFSTAHFEGRQFDFELLGARDGDPESFVLAGPTCDSLDVVSRSVTLPSDTQPGDHLVAHHAGAYSISVKSHFNGMAQITTAVQQHAVARVWVQ